MPKKRKKRVQPRPTPERRLAADRVQDRDGSAFVRPAPTEPVRPRPASTTVPASSRGRASQQVRRERDAVHAGTVPRSDAVPVAAPTAVATLPPSRPPRLALRVTGDPVEVTSFNCKGLEGVEPQGLGMTYWFDAAPDGEPYPVSVHFSGRLRGDASADRPATFSTVSTIERVVPGSGRVSMTTRMPNLAPGTWDVTATPVQQITRPGGPQWTPVTDPRLPPGSASGHTSFLPVVRVRAPGVRLWAWPTMVSTGAVLALVVQAVLAARVGLPVLPLFLLSLLASLLGVAGAKGYYLATHPRELRSFVTSGMSVQGFVLVAIGTLLLGSVILDLPVGSVLDVSAPGLLFGMTVGRLGCLLGGCCAGRPTNARWGLWSSDRKLGVRRIPVQLLESAVAAVTGTAALLTVLISGKTGGGLLFLAALGAYIAGRQLLFPLRDIARITKYGRTITLVLASLISLGSIILLVV